MQDEIIEIAFFQKTQVCGQLHGSSFLMICRKDLRMKKSIFRFYNILKQLPSNVKERLKNNLKSNYHPFVLLCKNNLQELNLFFKSSLPLPHKKILCVIAK